MSADDRGGVDWSHQEIDLIVADYFDMLQLELQRKPFVKSHRNAALQQLISRSKGSIEFKHQNISAVLIRLGLPWIRGYKPMANFQQALVEGVERHLDFVKDGILTAMPEAISGLADLQVLNFESPPQLTVNNSTDPPFLRRVVRKFDPAERDARNRTLGKMGEERVFLSERNRLASTGRNDLARKVRWVSAEDGDGAGFDILSFSESGEERLLEVKTTSGHQTTPFYISENERLLSVERPREFRLVRLYDFARQPKAFELVPPLEESVILKATSYRAFFESTRKDTN